MNFPKLSAVPRGLEVRVSDLIITSQELRDLAQWYDKLEFELTPGRTGERTSRSVPGPRLPLRVDVLDALIEIQGDTISWETFLRAETRQPVIPNGDAVRSLNWVADALERWPANNRPKWLDSLVVTAGRRHTQVKILLGLEQRPLTVRLRCPYCNHSLVIKLDQGLLLCRSHHCRCATEDCACRTGRGHSWKESEWRHLGLMLALDTPAEHNDSN
jgi:hypothetical protein